MKTFYDAYETNNELEAGKGIDLDYGNAGVITIHRAGGANRKYLQTVEAKLAPYRHQIQTKTLDDDLDSKLMADIYAASIIVGWKGVKGRDGKTMAFNKANVVKLLTDLPDLFADIKTQAANAANFRAKQIEEEAKNSEKS